MRLLVLTPWWPTSAGDPHGSFIRDQALALAAAGHDVRIGVLRLVRPPAASGWLRSRRRGGGSRGSRALVQGGPPLTLALGTWLPYRQGYDVLLRQWEHAMGRLVLRQGTWARHSLLLVHSQDLAIPAHRLCRRIGLPYVVVAHGLEPDSPRYSRASRARAYEVALDAAKRVIAVGPSLAHHLRQEAPHADVRVVLNGFDRARVDRILSEPPSVSAEPRIASVSNLNEGKGIHLTLEALAGRKACGAVVPRYDVVGDGAARRSLEALTSRLQLDDHVRFHGALPRDEALRVVRGAAAFVLPSSPEACGVAYLEAMALGVAPIAIRGQGPAAFIQEGVSGMLVDRTVPALEVAIDRVLEAGAAARLGERAGCIAEAHDWKSSALALLEALPEAGLGPRRRSTPTWLSLYNEPTPYVTGKQDEIECDGVVRLRRAWVAADASQSWGQDASYRAEDLVNDVPRLARVVLDLLRGRYAGLHSGGWGGNRVTPILLVAAWLGRRPLIIESDTHVHRSGGWRAAVRRVYLRFLDRRVRAWLPGGTPQAESLVATVAPRAPVLIEGMTTDTTTLLAEAERLGLDAAPQFRRDLGVRSDALLVLYVGRIAPEKGVPDLVEATARLLAEGLDVCLALVGPGTLDPAVAACLPSDRLRAPGRARWRALVPAYLAADVLALPSSFEPWGLVVNEALLLGCPVVVSEAVGAARDMVEGLGTGVVVPVGSVQDLTAGLRTVLCAGGRDSEFGVRASVVGRSWSRRKAATAVLRGMVGGVGPRSGGVPC